ncbi:MAG: hypothetical protein CMC13_15820 [Flavobacteriaceae bacterium]|nr:hypothetical protein [Flavobacteriaceae bacterium]|tara:strand:+ start:878 stop:1708 length:831 start_codon:yes stop_codon:yes gene_type:complete
MAETINEFVKSIPNWNELKPVEKVDYFAYFIAKSSENETITPSVISSYFKDLKQIPYSNIPQYLKNHSDRIKRNKKRIKYLYDKTGYHLESGFEYELKDNVNTIDPNFAEFQVDEAHLGWKTSDIPFLNSKIKRNAHFFTKLYFLFYHLENSLRKFLVQRLTAIIGTNWEAELVSKVDLRKAEAIKTEVDLSEMLPNRGENILFYCMWDDYASIILEFPQIFDNKRESNEIVAHLGTLTKIRNAIAHNVATIPKEYQDELTIFLRKFISILKKNEG